MGGILVIMLGLIAFIACGVFFLVIALAFAAGALGFAEETRHTATKD